MCGNFEPMLHRVALALCLTLGLLVPALGQGTEFPTVGCHPLSHGVETSASGLNAAGFVVGSCQPIENSPQIGFLRDPSGTVTFFSAPGPQPDTLPEAINNSNVVTGFYSFSGSTDSHGFVFRDGVVTPFDVPGSTSTVPTGINDSGVITGNFVEGSSGHGFLRQADGSFEKIDVPGYLLSPMAINASGEITGAAYYDEVHTHGFIRDTDGNVTIFDPPGDTHVQTYPFSINSSGLIVGVWYDVNSVRHGMMRDPMGNVTSFDVPHARTVAQTGTMATSVNDSGEIVGWALSDTGMVFLFAIFGTNAPIEFVDPDAITNGFGRGTFAIQVNAGGAIIGSYTKANLEYGSFNLPAVP